jgi:hypothetical protein
MISDRIIVYVNTIIYMDMKTASFGFNLAGENMIGGNPPVVYPQGQGLVQEGGRRKKTIKRAKAGMFTMAALCGPPVSGPRSALL